MGDLMVLPVKNLRKYGFLSFQGGFLVFSIAKSRNTWNSVLSRGIWSFSDWKSQENAKFHPFKGDLEFYSSPEMHKISSFQGGFGVLLIFSQGGFGVLFILSRAIWSFFDRKIQKYTKFHPFTGFCCHGTPSPPSPSPRDGRSREILLPRDPLPLPPPRPGRAFSRASVITGPPAPLSP